ncbi:hypothetical protein ANCDUO_16589, partial [Ancylostoma duodenale]
MRSSKADRTCKKKESSTGPPCTLKRENHEISTTNVGNDDELSKMSVSDLITYAKERNKDPTIEHVLELLFQKIPREISQEGEAEKRSRTIVISGIKESAEGLRPTERSHDLKSKVDEILDALDIDCNISNVFRIGKPNGNRPRLVKS